MKALSIHQPWSWAILHAGKIIENRTWHTTHRGPILIHASKSRASYDAVAPMFAARFGVELPPFAELPTRALVGVVDLLDCVQVAQASRRVRLSPWFEGPVAFVLGNPRPFAEAIPWRGQQRLFEVDAFNHAIAAAVFRAEALQKQRTVQHGPASKDAEPTGVIGSRGTDELEARR